MLAAGGPHLAALLERVEERLRAAAASVEGPVAGWAEATIAAGGKRLRPLLVGIAGGPGAPPEPLARAAAAVELIHAATLVHDDVLDSAPLRRGRPTVWSIDGRLAALATGDALFARAFTELAANDDVAQVRALSRASSALARGELLQREDAWRAPTVERYLERCELKTARLFEAACELGDLAAVRAPALGSFGRGIGLAFQLLDDVLDVTGPPERTGKHRGTDLLDGTVTLPFVLARDLDPALAALDPRSIDTPAEAERVCDAIVAAGGAAATRERALAIVAEAKEGLPAGLAPQQREALELVADGVVERYA